MSEAWADDGRSTTRVVFALSVSSRDPIPELDSLRARSPRAGYEYHYDVGVTSSVDDLVGDRLHPLDATVNSALDRLDATGVSPDVLARDDRIVDARFSVSPGSEILPAAVIARLARIHANVLMDSWG